MIYADHVEKHFGAEYIFEVGDRVITTKDVCAMASYIKKGTVVTIIDVGARGYDLQDDFGNRVIETGWNKVKHIQED